MTKKSYSPWDFNGQKLANIATPTAPADAATKAYVDANAGGGVQKVFVQSSAPVSPPTTYIWIQTGLGTDGTDFTFWFEDGT